VRIGVYVDGFNLYYGARGLCGRGTPGWRWLDLRALATDLAGRRSNLDSRGRCGVCDRPAPSVRLGAFVLADGHVPAWSRSDLNELT
jgi:hypothetical protein